MYIQIQNTLTLIVFMYLKTYSNFTLAYIYFYSDF